jgi:hypothetical protein
VHATHSARSRTKGPALVVVPSRIDAAFQSGANTMKRQRVPEPALIALLRKIESQFVAVLLDLPEARSASRRASH